MQTSLSLLSSSYCQQMAGRLSDPIMSLIDTGCVGQVDSIQLAALGPNTSIFNFVFQVESDYSISFQLCQLLQ
jgi:hypothetical protein